MRLGVAVAQADPWHFFQDVYDDLITHYEVDVFKYQQKKYPIFNERINKFIFHRNLMDFLESKDVVFFEWASVLLAAASHRPKKSKIITRLHRYEWFEWSDQITWSQVDKVILVSQAMLRKFSEKYPEYSYKTVVIPVGISTKKFRPSSKDFTGDIGILCNLTPRKRVYDLILSFYELHTRNRDLHLHIAGGSELFYSDYFESLRTIVERLALQECVTFYGRISEPQNWYQKIDIFVSNSYSEGMQVSPMEAMASGCYCLSHHWEGAEELLPLDHLFFTSTQLIDKVLRYCDLPESAKREEKARMTAIAHEKFDIEKIRVSIRQVIEEVGNVSFEG